MVKVKKNGTWVELGKVNYFIASDDDFNGQNNGGFRIEGPPIGGVVIPLVVKSVPLTSYFYLFNSPIFKSISVISNNPNITTLEGMFSTSSSNLVSLDLSAFETSNVKNISFMFSECSKLESLDISGFDVSNVTNANHMFRNCVKLSKVYVKDTDTKNKLESLTSGSLPANITFVVKN